MTKSLTAKTKKGGRTLTKRGETILVDMLNSGQFEVAKEYVDRLLVMNVPITIINRASYETFMQYLNRDIQNGRTAKELGKIFSDYYWDDWLALKGR